MVLRIVKNVSHDVFYNLALEQALFEYFYLKPSAVMIRFWKNAPAAIVGRSQDLLAEVNLEFCAENNIDVARRVSGGGAVYHDLGNLNLSFFISLRSLSKWSIRDIHTAREFLSNEVAKVLANLGYEVTVGNRSSLFLGNNKVSGSGAYFRKNILLHEMTLLLDVDLSLLEQVLNAKPGYSTSRFPSVYSPTTNLTGLSEKRFLSELTYHFSSLFHLPAEIIDLLQKEKNLASYLERTLYRNKDWIIYADRSALPPRLPL